MQDTEMTPQENSPMWYQHLKDIKAELSSMTLEDLETWCKELLQEAEQDEGLDTRIKNRMQANLTVALSSKRYKLRRALRGFLEDITPKLHPCIVCAHKRLCFEPLDDREPLRCGSSQMYFTSQTCAAPDDQPSDWLSQGQTKQSSAKSPDSSLGRGGSRELDVLAFVAEAVSMRDDSVDKRKKDLSVQRPEKLKGRRSVRKRIPGQYVSQGFEALECLSERQQEAKSMLDVPASLYPSTPSKEDTVHSIGGSPSVFKSLRSANAVTGFTETNASNLTVAPLQLDSKLHNTPAFNEAVSVHASLLTGLRGLGRAISDPQVLQRELARGIPPLEEEDTTRLATAAGVLRAGVESSSYNPGRPLSRAISDPRKLQQDWRNAAEACKSALQSNTPARGNLVQWQAVVRFTAPLQTLDLFTLVAALPESIAATLPSVIPLDGIRPRDAIRMDTVLDKPLLLQLGPVDASQRHAVIQMERSKIAVFAQFPTFDLVLVPHLNSRELLHIIGLRMEKDTRPQSAISQSYTVAPLSRTVSAMPALGKGEKLYDAEAAAHSRAHLNVIKE